MTKAFAQNANIKIEERRRVALSIIWPGERDICPTCIAALDKHRGRLQKRDLNGRRLYKSLWYYVFQRPIQI